jgi:ammonium transporter Rh
VSTLLRKGKLSFSDMANAALAGGVAVGATCNVVSPAGAFGIGLLAGTVCVVGYAIIQPRVDGALKVVDTCGVHNLHGMPGVLGGLTAAVVVPGIAKAQLIGIALTVVIALGCGAVGGYLIRLFGEKLSIYEDAEEFAGAGEPEDGEVASAALIEPAAPVES